MHFGAIQNLLKLFKAEYTPYRWQILLLGILSFLSGVVEGFGITAIIPIFSFASKGKAESADVISQYIEKFFVYFHIPFTLKILLIFIIALFCAKSILLFTASHIAAYITTTYERKTKTELFHSVLQSNWEYLSRQKVGYLSQILNTDVSNSSALLAYISSFIITSINLAIYTLLILNISPVIALLTVIFGIIMFFSIKPLLQKNKALSQEVTELYKDSAHYVEEAMIGIKAIKSMFLEKGVEARSFSFFERVRILTMRSTFIKNIISALLQPFGLVLIIAIFAYFYKMSAFSFASFAVVVYAINKVFANIDIAQIKLHKISFVAPYLGAVVAYKKIAAVCQESDQGTRPFSFVSKLEFKNVHFAYTATKGILSDVSFSIKKGEMTGIIGPSGSGKTTITDLILRLFKPQKGEILIDGEPIDAIKLSEWRTKIGYVSQDSYLINDTIENNIKFYNDKISNVDIERAAKMANIYGFIYQLPDKFNTLVGERGVKLSGGQRQRVILARVLARNPEVLILDEATSALDSESESLIQETINALKGTITVIVIAHRLSTVMVASKLLVIDSGKILEQGSPDELLISKDTYLSRVYNLR